MIKIQGPFVIKLADASTKSFDVGWTAIVDNDQLRIGVEHSTHSGPHFEPHHVYAPGMWGVVEGQGPERIRGVEPIASIANHTKRLLNALDAMDHGCREPGFRGHENGLGDSTAGDELQAAREELAALVGHVIGGTKQEQGTHV